MHVTDLEGNEYALQATYTHKLELNGNRELSSEIKSNKVNDLFIKDLSNMWNVIDDDEVEHKILYAKKSGAGERLKVSIRAIPLFYDEFDTDRIYEEYNEHMTADAFFSLVFSGTNFNFVLMDSFLAVQWQGLGKGESRLSAFKKGLNRYKSEFRISGNTVYLESRIGRDTQFMYRHRLNASNIQQESDASALWTFARGYGDFAEGEEENANLIREYTSPLAEIIGTRHAPPIYNGNITVAETMDEQLKELVDNSLKLSVTADIHDLRNQGYALAQPEVGDRVFLIDERIGLNDEVRINDISITRNWKGEILDLQLTFGSENITKRHQSNLQTAISRITELMEGSLKLPYSVVDDAILQATQALKSAQTELLFENGIIARDENDPNFLVWFNSKGIGVSNDGGATFPNAITGEGIVADLITVGTMLFDRIQGGTLTLGGLGNTNGIMRLLNSEGDVIADLDADRGGFSSLYIDDLEAGNVNAPNVAQVTDRDLTYYVRGETGDDSNSGLGDWNNALYSLEEAYNRIPAVVNHTIIINVSNLYDINAGVTRLQGKSGGGTIIVDFRGNEYRGQLAFTANSCYIQLVNTTVTANVGTTYVVDNQRCTYFYMNNVVMNGQGHEYGLRTWQNGFTYVINSEIYNVEDAIRASSGGRMHVQSVVGLGDRYGLVTETSGQITGSGTAPMGIVANTMDAGSGQIIGNWTHDSGSATPPAPPVVETTQTFNPTGSGQWRPNFGGQWNAATYSTPYQGRWGEWGTYKGLWFFGNSIYNAVNGASISRIRIRPRRRSSGGSSASASVVFRTHTYASQPNGEPTVSSHSHTSGFTWGQRKWVTLPAAFRTAFENGARGIAIYTTSTSSGNYAIFEGGIEVEITYETEG